MNVKTEEMLAIHRELAHIRLRTTDQDIYDLISLVERLAREFTRELANQTERVPL